VAVMEALLKLYIPLRGAAGIGCVILLAILLAEVLVLPAPSDNTRTKNVQVSGGAGGIAPTLVFAVDQSTPQLTSLLSQTGVMADLKELKAGIALSLPDIDTGRAQIVEQLNKAGIPLTAWLALPGEEGYYLNNGNEPEAAARFAEFERWTVENRLHWAAIGLDIEPQIQDFTALGNNKLRFAATLVGRYFEFDRARRARESYAALIREIHSHGYAVETYQFPFIADERKMHTTLLERLAGIVDVRGDKEVLMLYSSFNPKIDSGLIWAYGPEAQAIAVGSTMGSDSDRRFVPLSWEDLSRDLLVAHHFSETIGVYNLEGCIRQGFLPRLVSMDWRREVNIPPQFIDYAAQFRKRVETAIWIGSHLPHFALIAIITIGAGIAWWRPRRRKMVPPAGKIG